jgi:hypothetical protein
MQEPSLSHSLLRGFCFLGTFSPHDARSAALNQHLLLERQIANQATEPDILSFMVLHPLSLIELNPTVFLAPAVKALLLYPCIPTGLWRRFFLRHRHFNLTKQRYNLLGTKPLPARHQTSSSA